jgi:ribokinase
MRFARPKVIVVGSLNVDYIAGVERLPAAGETVAATDLLRRFGGKGANQAVAAARQGAKVTLIGCVGADDNGRAYLKHLRREGIDVTGMSRSGNAPTGTALIAVDTRGENTIIVAAGANGELTPKSFAAVNRLLAKAKAVLLQFEIPIATTNAVIGFANRAGIPVLLNPSPLKDGFPWGRYQLDTLIVNAGEAQAIFGLPLEGMADRLQGWRKTLAESRVARLIITRGAQPTLCLGSDDYLEVPSLPVKPVDTVGAGDAFAGTFVARRAEGLDLLTAIRLANCAGALTTLKPGAQEAIPHRAATEKAGRMLT